MKELRERRMVLIHEIQSIEAQLGIKRVYKINLETNEPPTPVEYAVWRKGAIIALLHRLNELRQVNLDLKEEDPIMKKLDQILEILEEESVDVSD